MGTYVDLLKACKEGNQKRVKKLLHNCPNISDVRDLTDKTLLHYCFKHSLCADLILEVAPELLDVGDKAGYTVLHLASMMKPPSSLQYILSKHPDVNKRNNDSRTSLLLAVIYENYEAVRILCEHGADLDIIDSSGISPLHYAAKAKWDSEKEQEKEQEMHMIDLLLEFKANIEFHDFYSRTPLMWAVCLNNLVKMRHLIKRGANLYARDVSGLSILHYATSNGNRELIQSLLEEYRFDVEARDNNECTALMYACTMSQVEIMRMLLQYSADPNSHDSKKRNCAHFVCGKGSLECLELVQEHGTALWCLNIDNNYPLHEASYRGHQTIVSHLIEHAQQHQLITKDVINQKNSNNQTPLHLAAVKDHLEICKLLLESGAEPNVCLRANNGKSMTALDLANETTTKTMIVKFEGRTADHLIRRAPIKEETTVSLDTDDSYSEDDEEDEQDDAEEEKTAAAGQQREVEDEENEIAEIVELSQVWKATLDGDVDLLEKFARQGGSLSRIRDDTGKTVLHYSLKNDASFAYISRSCGAELVNEGDEAGLNVLGLAIMLRSNSRIAVLLGLGADLARADGHGRGVLHLCVVYDNLEALELLTAGQGPLLHWPDQAGNWPLHYAVEAVRSRTHVDSAVEFVRRLLTVGWTHSSDISPFECRDAVNRTPLLLAVNLNSAAIVRLLLQDPEYSNSSTGSPDHAISSSAEIGSSRRPPHDLLARDNQGLCSVHYACAEANLEVLDLLVAAAARRGSQLDPDLRDPNGLSPAFYAVGACADKVLRRLMELGADLNLKDHQGRSLCHKAAEKGAFLCLKLLLAEGGLDPWAASADGNVPLHEAAYRGYKEVAEILLQNATPTGATDTTMGALDARNSSGQTPLHLAADRNDCPMCYLLVSHGSNVNATIFDAGVDRHLTPLDLANTKDCRETLIGLGGYSARKLASGRQGSAENEVAKEAVSSRKDSVSNLFQAPLQLTAGLNDSIQDDMDGGAESIRSTELTLSTLPASSRAPHAPPLPLPVAPAPINNIDDVYSPRPRSAATSQVSSSHQRRQKSPREQTSARSGSEDAKTKQESCSPQLSSSGGQSSDEQRAVNSPPRKPSPDNGTIPVCGVETESSRPKPSTRESSKLSSSGPWMTKSKSTLSAKKTTASNGNSTRSSNQQFSSRHSFRNNQRSSLSASANGFNSKRPMSSSISSLLIDEKIKSSILQYEYVRINAQRTVEIARQRIRQETLDKLTCLKTPKTLRRLPLLHTPLPPVKKMTRATIS